MPKWQDIWEEDVFTNACAKTFSGQTCLSIVFTIPQRYVSCAKNRVTLRQNRNAIQLFSSTVPLELVAIHILGQLLMAVWRISFLHVINDRFLKLVKKIAFTHILAGTVAKAFVENWEVV